MFPVNMFGLCCFAQSGAVREPPKTRPLNLLEEPADNLEAFKEGLRSISTPATSFQKIGPEMVANAAISSSHGVQALTARKFKKAKNGDIIPPRDMEVFERRQFEAYKEEVEKRRRLQLIERQMALFNTWEFYNEQEMWDLLVRYNQYIQSGHQIFLTPMPDCPIHGHSITSKHQQSKRGHKPHKKPKQRRRQSASSLSDDHSSPSYASQYSDNQRRSDRSRSSLTSQVSAEIHSVEKASIPSVLKIMTAAEAPLPSDASEKDSGIDKSSINSSIDNGSDRSSRKFLEHAQQHEGSPVVPHKHGRRTPSPPPAVENDYDLDVPPKTDEDDTHEPTDYHDYREGIYYAREEIKPDPAFGAIWENSTSAIINAYEDMEIGREEVSRIGACRRRQRDESNEFAPLNEPQPELVYGNEEVVNEEEPTSEVKENDVSAESALNSIEKYYIEQSGEGCLPPECHDLLECKGDQCSPSKVMLRSLNLSNHSLAEIPKSNDSSLERKHAYSKVNKEGMKIYDLMADVRDTSTPPPPLPVKRIDALIHEEQDFYDDSRGQPESESLERSTDTPMAADEKISPAKRLADIHQPPRRTLTPSPPRTVRQMSPPRTPEQESVTDGPLVVDEQPRRGHQQTVLVTASIVQLNNAGDEALGDATGSDTSKVAAFDMPKLRDASERKITPISEESDELSIRTEIQKVITKLHKTGGWRKATCTPGEPYLTLDLRKETKGDAELPIPDFELRAKEPTLTVSEPAPADAEGGPASEALTLPVETAEKPKPYSQIDMEALDFNKAREALKKFTNDGSNPLLKQVPNRSIPLLAEEARTTVSETALTPARAKLTKTVSAPPNLKGSQTSLAQPAPAEASAIGVHGEPVEVAEPAPPDAHQIGARDEDEDRINFKAARETLQKLTSLNNGMFFMTDRKTRQAF